MCVFTSTCTRRFPVGVFPAFKNRPNLASHRRARPSRRRAKVSSPCATDHGLDLNPIGIAALSPVPRARSQPDWDRRVVPRATGSISTRSGSPRCPPCHGLDLNPIGIAALSPGPQCESPCARRPFQKRAEPPSRFAACSPTPPGSTFSKAAPTPPVRLPATTTRMPHLPSPPLRLLSLLLSVSPCLHGELSRLGHSLSNRAPGALPSWPATPTARSAPPSPPPGSAECRSTSSADARSATKTRTAPHASDSSCSPRSR